MSLINLTDNRYCKKVKIGQRISTIGRVSGVWIPCKASEGTWTRHSSHVRIVTNLSEGKEYIFTRATLVCPPYNVSIRVSISAFCTHLAMQWSFNHIRLGCQCVPHLIWCLESLNPTGVCQPNVAAVFVQLAHIIWFLRCRVCQSQ